MLTERVRYNDRWAAMLGYQVAELPPDANDPVVVEFTSSNGFPTAILVLHGAGGETLRRAGFVMKKELEGLDGVDKMSKSKNNYIGVTEDANSMFAKVLSISDTLMWRWYTLLSFRSEAEIAALKKEVEGGRNPKDAKVMLAREITARFHNAAAADAAEQDFINRSKGGVPDDIPDVALSGAPLGIGALLKQANLAPSTSEANRLIDGGGVRVDGSVVSDKGLKLEAGTYVVQVGKRKFARVTLG